MLWWLLRELTNLLASRFQNVDERRYTLAWKLANRADIIDVRRMQDTQVELQFFPTVFCTIRLL